MNGRNCVKGRSLLQRTHCDNLSPWKRAKKKLSNSSSKYLVSSGVTPAITEGTNLFETLASQILGELDQSGGSARRVCSTSNKCVKFLFGPIFELFNSIFLSLSKEIGHEDLSAHGLSQDISSL